ncbi:hypothetical protein LINPERPRIM_LOCUS30893, partial [Linum perenne]
RKEVVVISRPQVPQATNLGGSVLLGKYRKLEQHAEAYPYVWGSHIVAYGLWFAYRWRKLRQTEDRVHNQIMMMMVTAYDGRRSNIYNVKVLLLTRTRYIMAFS